MACSRRAQWPCFNPYAAPKIGVCNIGRTAFRVGDQFLTFAANSCEISRVLAPLPAAGWADTAIRIPIHRHFAGWWSYDNGLDSAIANSVALIKAFRGLDRRILPRSFADRSSGSHEKRSCRSGTSVGSRLFHRHPAISAGAGPGDQVGA